MPGCKLTVTQGLISVADSTVLALVQHLTAVWKANEASRIIPNKMENIAMLSVALVPKLDHGVCPSPAADNRASWTWKCSEMNNKDNCKYSKGTIVYDGNFKPGEKLNSN